MDKTEIILPIITELDKSLPFFVTGIGRQYPQLDIDRENGFSSHQILFVEKGEGVLLAKGNKQKFSSGEILFIPKGIYHSYFSTSQNLITRWISFDGKNIGAILKYLDFTKPKIFRVSDVYPFEQKHQELMKCAKKEQSYNLALLSSNVYNLLFEIQYNACNEKSSSLDNVIHYIKQNFAEELTLDNIANQFNMSKFKLCKCFKNEYKITVFEYLLQVRIQQAKYIMLSNPDIKIKDVAANVGFNDTGYFIKIFKKYENITPTQFKATHK